VSAVRYLDLTLLAASGAFVALAGLPVIGWAFAAGAWLLSRALAEYLEHRAEPSDLRARLSAHFGGMMARVAIVAAAVVGASVVGDRDDAVTAAVVSLVVFTVYLGTSAAARQLERNVVRP
jgi:hypothetical protein